MHKYNLYVGVLIIHKIAQVKLFLLIIVNLLYKMLTRAALSLSLNCYTLAGQCNASKGMPITLSGKRLHADVKQQ